MEIQKNELLRYLGWRGQEMDDSLQTRLDNAAKLCMEIARPRCTAKKFILTDEMRLEGTDVRLEGKDIRAHLAGCRAVYLFAATLGIEPKRETDRLFAEGKATEALLLDTAASCAIESYVEDICSDLQNSESRSLTACFACGYGDFPLSVQPTLLRLLSADTRIGLCTDETFALMPEKSITAFVGITDRPAEREKYACGNKCARCKHGGCAYRKE